MSTKLSDVWSQVEAYLPMNLSIIPVRDKDSEDGKYFAKSPIGKWTYNQQHRYTKEELWKSLEKFDTSAVGIVCGEVSENLEVIDIDSKYQPGIDAILFKDIEKFYPELWPLLRLHKTPSGGFHIMYRIDGGKAEGNQKLAGRIPTEYEIEQDQLRNPLKRKKLSEINFLETRGEGGQIVAPPSIGYSVYRDVPIPVITWEQRCSLINLCRAYNQIIKEIKAYSTPKTENSQYSVNPFEDYNMRCDPAQLCEDNGWKREKENAHFIWFTRPGKNKGVSLSWNKEKHIFYSFSSSTDLDASRGYNAASFLAIYQFNNDRKAAYKWLVENGYGQLKTAAEKAIIQRAKIKGTQAPANLSEAATTELQAELDHAKEQYPYGIFWNVDAKDRVEISRERLYQVCSGLGLMNYKEEPVQVTDGKIYKLTENAFYNVLKNYITEEDAELYEKICNVFEPFVQHNGAFTISRLLPLTADLIMSDTVSTAYKFFANGYIKITADAIVFNDYAPSDLLIWADKIQTRNWNPVQVDTCKYNEYLHLAIGYDEHLLRVIGYLCHDYKDENTGWIIVCTEKCPDPKQGGGSGKNLFGLLLKNNTQVFALPGEQISLDHSLLQSWNYERVIMISDLPKRFNMLWFKDISTGYVTRKRLFKNVETISPYDMGKFLFNTNYSYDISDGGLERRIRTIEFTDYFTKCGGVNKHFKGLFPTSANTNSIWDEQDWQGYDWTIAAGIKLYLQDSDLKAAELSEGGWEKQFKQQFGQNTFEFITEHFYSWCEKQMVETAEFNRQYHDFCKEANITHLLSGITMNMALKSYCERANVNFNGNIQNSVTKKKSKEFRKVTDPEVTN